MLGQWATEMNHVAAIVGGFNSQQKHAGQQGVIFKPIAREKQAGAVQFLNDNAFQTPTWAINPDILRRIEPVGVLDRVRTGQQRVLNSLLSSARIMRLVEQEALDGAAAYRAARLPRRRAQGHLERDLRRRAGQGGPVSPQPPARLRRNAGRPRQRPPGGGRRRAGVLPRRAEDARRRPATPPARAPAIGPAACTSTTSATRSPARSITRSTTRQPPAAAAAPRPSAMSRRCRTSTSIRKRAGLITRFEAGSRGRGGGLAVGWASELQAAGCRLQIADLKTED